MNNNNNMIYCKSLWNGWHGNECVHNKDYKTAVKYYNNAIEMYPMEYRYFVNRSYCYDQLEMYELALEDANMAVMLKSDWGKCHFRRGRALKGLKRLQEAENCFFKVMQLEGNDCEEAKCELLSIRKFAIISFGTDSRIACDVANKCVNISQAINTIKQMEHFKNDEKFTDKHKSKIKRSNKSYNPSIKSKNISYGRQQSFPNINTRQDKSHSQIHKINSIVSDDSKSYRSIRIESNDGKNVLKKLNEILLSSYCNNTEDHRNVNQNLETSRDESPVKIEENIEIKCSIEDNKSIKSFKSDSNRSNHSNESKSRFAVNKNNRNGKNNCNIDQIVEHRENERSVTVRSTNSSHSDTNRNLEPTNPWRFKGLWISNIIPNDHSKKTLHEILGKFGKITFFGMIPESETAIINFDNPESPRLAMSKLQGVHMPNICVNNERLKVKFRPLQDSENYPSIYCASDRQLNNECYFWRTTGCIRFRDCKLKHIPANKGVDLQPWMQNLKGGHKRQNRQRFGTL